MTESQIQAEIIIYARNELRLPKGTLFSIPNEGQRDGRFASRMKSQGMVAGVPDLCLILRGRTVFIEMKTAGGRLSDKQTKVIDNMRAAGADVRICRSKAEFAEIVRSL